MRANPTPVIGPVSIKHIRNNVPTETKKAAPIDKFLCYGSRASKSFATAIASGQLEEPSL